MFDDEELNQLYRFCYSLTTDESSAADLLQTALEKYLKSQRTITNQRAFIYRIIRNQFIDDYRRQRKRPTETLEIQDYPDFDVKTLESLVIDDDLIEQVMLQLDSLEREILFYWAVEGYSTREIANMLALPKGTVLSRIQRMRLRIQQMFPEASSLQNEEANL